MYKTSVFIVLLLALPILPAAAKKNHSMPDTISIEEASLQRCSYASVMAFSMFKVGHAALYRDKCDNLDQNFYADTLQLSFKYYKEIPGDAFTKSATNFLRKNLSSDEYAQIEEQIDRFNAHYQDVKKGDQYDLVYIPGEGIKLYLNNELLCLEENEVFSKAYFAIWFGEKPFNKKLKKNLLNI